MGVDTNHLLIGAVAVFAVVGVVAVHLSTRSKARRVVDGRPPLSVSKERLLICAGFSFCLFVVAVFYASPVAAVVFVFIGANLVRESRSRNSGLL